jgi:hypothetical protein
LVSPRVLACFATLGIDITLAVIRRYNEIVKSEEMRVKVMWGLHL